MTVESTSVGARQAFRERPSLEVALAAASVGAFELRPATGRMRWTEVFASLHGLDPDALEGTLGEVEKRVHPDDRARLRRTVEDSAGDAFEVQYRLEGPETRWLELRGAPVSRNDSRTIVAGTCSDVTVRKRREEALAKAHVDALKVGRRSERLRSFTAALGHATREAEVVDVVLREGVVALHARAAAFFELSEGGSTLELLGSIGHADEPAIPGPARDAIATGRLVVAEEQSGAVLCAPVEVGGRVHGALSMTFHGPRRFDEEDQATFETIVAACSQALERARLYEAQREARGDALRLARRLRVLQSVMDVTLESQSLDELLNGLLARLREALGTDTASIFVFDEERYDLVARAAVGLEVEVERGVRVPVGQGFAGQIATRREPWIVEDTSKIELFSPFLRAHGVGSLAGVPLLADDRLVGVLDVGTFDRRAFSEEDVMLLKLVASRAALAVEQALLHERHRAVAETLQRSLLPERMPEAPEFAVAARYVPGGVGLEVGGDWYDTIAFDDGRLGVVVGDVVGRGIAAAAAMGQLRNGVRAYVFEGLGPAAVLNRLNHLAVEMGAQDLFATCVLLLLDPRRGELRMASAGHPPPLLVPPDEDPRYLEGGRSLPLGTNRAATYEDAVVRLAPGDVVVAFTDGLVERRDMPIDEGLARLEAAVGGDSDDLEELLDRLLVKFVPGEHGDDVAIVAVRQLERPVEPIRLRYAAVPSSLAQVRGALREWLEHAHVREDEIYEIAVACNEACTNAIEHPLRSPESPFFELEGTCAGDVVSLVVRDFGRWREPRADGDRGRGLKFIHALMDSVDVRPTEEGTEIRMRRKLGGRE